MNEKIGEVTLNYNFYKGEDLYSDGEIEDKLLDIVQKCENEEDIYQELLMSDEWPILYHLSPIRHNILEWYDFEPNGSVLEIGAGCGAISGLFCKKLYRVVALDLSKKRSLINANRNRNYNNLEIIVANFEDVEINEKFDYVSLIGVLEYAIYYINSPDPFVDMLKKVRSFLKPNGKLLLAIENKYGLKYWAGATEDHTGNLFDGIQGYENVDRVRTFSRKSLEKLLRQAGFEACDFYYPYPDYKLPLEIFSEEHLPKKGDIKAAAPSYDRDRISLFNEVQAIDSICEDGLFEEFANSFLVIAN